MTEIDELRMQNAIQGALLSQTLAFLFHEKDAVDAVMKAYQDSFAKQFGDTEESTYAQEYLEQIWTNVRALAEEAEIEAGKE